MRLQPQPAQVLALLVAHPERVVTRDELRQAVWGDQTFVDFDRGLNFCIAQIRTALGDDAGAPRYVRTIPKKGYQFICPVRSEAPDPGPERHTPAAPTTRSVGWRTALAVLGLAALIGSAVAVFSRKTDWSGPPVVAVARFDNETGDPALTRYTDYLTDSVVEQLTKAVGGRYGVVGNAAVLRVGRAQRDLGQIRRSVHADYVVLGQLQRDTSQLRVLGHLIRLPDQTHLTVARFDGVRDQTLAAIDQIATRMTQEFERRLKGREPRSSAIRPPSAELPQ